jgi:3-phosphoshikimate 1-carboxyvinyltransferase
VVPGDKSISHRALLLGALAKGKTMIEGFLSGEDPKATLNCLRALGVEIKEQGERVEVIGVGGKLKQPAQPLYVGNSGTTIRILSGILAAQNFDCEISGDASICQRPMRRIIDPISLMGGKIEGKRVGDKICPPLKIFGRKLKGISYKLPVASAQVKSAVMLAALLAEGITEIEEIAPSRDHTERMLQHFGAKIEHLAGHKLRLAGPQRLKGGEVTVPGDISSAAFFLAAAALLPGSEISIRNVGLNPTRTGLLEVLHRMGAEFEVAHEELISEEPRGEIKVQNTKAQLKAIEIGGALIPRLIDEIPVIAVLATQAEGKTVIKDAAELRVKESNRIATVCEELGKMGAQIEATADGLLVQGGTKLHGARVKSHGDHRLAMSLAVAGLIAEGETLIDDIACVETSFPRFCEVLNRVTK